MGTGGGQIADGVGQAQLLGGPPSGGDLAVGIAGGQTCREPGQRVGAEPVGAAAQQPADLVQRVTGVTSSIEGGLLDAAADLVNSFHPQGGDVEGVQHVGRRW